MQNLDIINIFPCIRLIVYCWSWTTTQQNKTKDYVQKYCRPYDRCCAQKPKKETNRAPLGIYISGEPMERVAVDIFGPLPLTKQGNKYILVTSDLFTKWTEAIAIPN
jgi:hypothetical protein